MMVDIHFHGVGRLDVWSKAVKTLQFVEIEAKDSLRMIYDALCPDIVVGSHDDVVCAGQKCKSRRKGIGHYDARRFAHCRQQVT